MIGGEMPVGETTVMEMLDYLLANSNPEGENHKRLTQIKGWVARGLLLGPNSRDYIAECLEKLDSIECKHVGSDVMCQTIRERGKCPFASKEKWKLCERYEPTVAVRKIKPINTGE